MENFCVYTILVFCGFWLSVNCQAQVEGFVPKIILAQQVSENSVKLQWAVPVQSYNLLTRYRIQLSTDNFVNNIQEWPAQILLVNYDTSDSWFFSTSRNNFGCFNLCIQNPECVFVSRLYDGNCYLKKTNTKPIDGAKFKNTEYAIVSNYTSQVTLTNIPYDQIYRFRVAVYGVNFTRWTDFSEPSNQVNMKLSLNISVERSGFNSVKVNWTKVGNFTNYSVSRYKIKLKFNYSPDREVTPDFNTFSTFELQPNYDDARFIINVSPIDRDSCVRRCYYNYTNCVAVVYLENTKECFIKEKRDIVNGYIRDQPYEILNLRNDASEYTFARQIYSNTSYRFQVDALTPYGTLTSSNEFIYSQNDSRPILDIYVNLYEHYANLTWSISETFPVKRFSIGTAKQNSSKYGYIIEYSNVDFGDDTQQIITAPDLTGCYEQCFNNKACVAYVWSSFSSICILKFQKVNPIECAKDTICATIPNYKNKIMIVDHLVNVPYCYKIVIQDEFGVNSLESKSNCFEFSFNVEAKNYSILEEKTSSNVECVYTPVNFNRIKAIRWYKDGKPVNLDQLNAEYTLNGRFLYFRELSHRIHNGRYNCSVELTTGQVINSTNEVDLLVLYDYRLDVYADSPIVRVNISDTVSIPCVVDGYPLPKIMWKFNLLGLQYVEIKNVTKVDFPTNSTLYLNLTNVEKKSNGTYLCTTVDGRQLSTIEVLVQTKPSQPNILNSYSNGNLTYINWKVEDYGQSNLTFVKIEWSKNFSNPILQLNYTFVEYSKIQNDEIKVNYIPVNTSVRITVYNQVGSSNTSAEKFISCLYCSTQINYNTSTSDTVTATSKPNGPPYVLIFSIVGSLLAALIIIVLVVVILNNKRCCAKKAVKKYNSDIISNLKDSLVYDSYKHQNPSQYEAMDNHSTHKIYSSPSSNDDFKKYTAQQFEYTYSVESLYETWIAKLHIIDKELANEFATIVNPINLTTNEAKRLCNHDKSRYKGIYPYDINRVELSEREGIEGSDFINASFIEGFFGRRKFIAAQAPTNQTVHDFFRMICEQNVKAIVMLTKFYEEEPLKLKCVPYWDDKCNMVFGDLTIKVTNVENSLTYIKRKLMIKNLTFPDFVHYVDHYHFIEWPDKSVPNETQSLVSVITRVNDEHTEKDWPILVHCSAGVGRTGTYIAYDLLLQSISNGNQINIYEVIVYLRHQRPYLVQTWEQYKFIHLAVLEFYLFGITSMHIDSCKLQMQIMSRRDENSNQSILDIQYRNVVSFKDKIRTTHIYSSYRNKFSSSIFKPYDSPLIKLSAINQDMSTMYVDAVLLRTSETHENYIIAADPTFDTMSEFVRMIFMKRISVIVSLSSQFYLPDENETVEIKQVVIYNRKKNFQNGVTSYILEFIDTRNNDSLSVYYYDHTNNWPSGQQLPANRGYYLSLVKDILYTIDPSNPNLNGIKQPLILVHSSDAGDRCGILVACCCLIKSIEITSKFDVVKLVLMLRRCRSNMISTFEAFKFLYEICVYYVDVITYQQSSKSDSYSRYLENSSDTYE